MITKKLSDFEIAVLEKDFDRALALLVEIFGAVVALRADCPLPLIQWKPRFNQLKTPRKQSDNDLICNAIRIAALASNRVPHSRGEMVCPKCGSKLIWNIHSSGKVWGNCDNINCLNFME